MGRRGGRGGAARLSEVGGEDIERLANRMALLVSDDGEADNAGRAVGQLARRLGLSGGDLKAMVLAGAGKGFRPGSSPGLIKLEQELDALRRDVRAAQDAARAAQHDRDALVAENGAMRVAMYRHRAGVRLRRLVLGLGLIGALSVAAGVVLFTPDSISLSGPVPQGATGLRPRGDGVAAVTRVVPVRSGGAVLRRDPDRESPVLARLGAGYKLLVLRMEPRGAIQWLLVEVDGRAGYVMASEVELN